MDRTAAFPEWIEPMAATLTQERFTGPEWIFERKVDGIRLLAFRNGSDVRLLSRNRLPQHCPLVAQQIAALPVSEVILDGELTWSGTAYHVFDILWLDGRDLRALPLDARRAVLATLPLRPPLQRVTPVDEPKPWERACREGWEGVIAKRRDSPYESRRSRHWLKMKCEATPGAGGRRLHGAQGQTGRPRRAARRLLRRRRLRLRGQGRHRVRREAAARAPRAAGRPRDPFAPVHAGHGPAPAGRALGEAGAGRRRSRSSNGRSTASSVTRACSGLREDKAAREVTRET